MAAKSNGDLSLFGLASAKTTHAQKLMDEARDLLKQDLENVRQEKSAFEAMTKTLNEVHFASTVKLNVGGKIYKTTLDTLRKDPDSMLSAMFSGRHELKADEEDGAYFIDRDAELFRYILNYLRNGEFICPSDKMVQIELFKEATFYQVQGIITRLQLELLPLKASVIIKNENHRLAVLSWLPPGASSTLLFRATTDGGTPEDFHRSCDNKGPTLVVIQSGEYICGGYTSRSWRSPESYIAIEDKRAFLFTLVNPSGSEPTKISPTAGAAGGIECKDDKGPRFATENDFDLVIDVNRDGDFVGESDLGNSFDLPPNADRNTFFTDESPFEITELEVFKIDF